MLGVADYEFLGMGFTRCAYWYSSLAGDYYLTNLIHLPGYYTYGLHLLTGEIVLGTMYAPGMPPHFPYGLPVEPPF